MSENIRAKGFDFSSLNTRQEIERPTSNLRLTIEDVTDVAVRFVKKGWATGKDTVPHAFKDSIELNINCAIFGDQQSLQKLYQQRDKL